MQTAALVRPTGAELVKAAQRELAMRDRVYAQQIMRGKMTQTQADHEIGCAHAWHSLSVLAPQIIGVLEAAAVTLHPNTAAGIATLDLAEELLGKLRTIVTA